LRASSDLSNTQNRIVGLEIPSPYFRSFAIPVIPVSLFFNIGNRALAVFSISFLGTHLHSSPRSRFPYLCCEHFAMLYSLHLLSQLEHAAPPYSLTSCYVPSAFSLTKACPFLFFVSSLRRKPTVSLLGNPSSIEHEQLRKLHLGCM